MLKIWYSDNTKCCQGCGIAGTCIHYLWESEIVQPHRKLYGQAVSYNSKHNCNIMIHQLHEYLSHVDNAVGTSLVKNLPLWLGALIMG